MHLKDEAGTLKVNNGGVQDAVVEVFSLVNTSPKIDRDDLPGPGSNMAVVDLKAVGVRGDTAGGVPYIEFGIASNGVRAHPTYPGEFDVVIDSNNDGNPDYVLFTAELGAAATTGTCIVFLADLTAGTAAPVYYCDADLNSGNMIMTTDLADIGLTALTDRFTFWVEVYDNYFTGAQTDGTTPATIAVANPRIAGAPLTAVAPSGGSATIAVTHNRGTPRLDEQHSGLLLLYRDAAPGKESEIVRVD